MSNFVEVFKAGKTGRNIGLPTGITRLDRAIGGIQRKTSYGLAAAPKVGKTTLTDFAFVISPYLHCLQNNTLDKIHWEYFSYEVDRISKEFKFAAFFMAHDHRIYHHDHRGTTYPMNQDYLMGKQLHSLPNGELEQVPITTQHEEILKDIYMRRIIPMFGEYDAQGVKIAQGKINIIEDPDNPTGMRNYLMRYAGANGKFNKDKYKILGDDNKIIEKERIGSYDANDPELTTIVITDHIRKCKMERGFTMKQNIDKWLEYSTWLRNLCGFTFLHVCHSNRQLANIDRLKFAGEWVFPTSDDVKDSGNLAEECTILMTMFNPGDEKYNLKRHMDIDLSAFPNYRSLHITESRYTECPTHIQLNMLGGINTFTDL